MYTAKFTRLFQSFVLEAVKLEQDLEDHNSVHKESQLTLGLLIQLQLLMLRLYRLS